MHKVIYLSFVWLPALCFAQTSSPVPAVKDAAAVALAQKALSAMGGPALLSYQDSSAKGAFVMHGSKDISLPASLESSGTNRYKIQVQRTSGPATYTMNSGSGCTLEPGHAPQPASPENIISRRVDYIPALSLLAEYQSSSVSVQYGGTTPVNGQMADIVSLTLSSPNIGAEDIQKVSQHLFYVDQKTGLVTKMQTTRFAENVAGVFFTAETYFSDYRSVNGLMVPFSQKLFLDGKPASELTLSSVTLNSGLPESDFALTCGGPNVN